MEQKFIRCAIYTRKSCEDGLEQEFNSLDAQRLAGENYIASQIHENWRLVSKHYDDGGFSGGNMNRPALKELFEDIKAGLIDMVVVYKIDRLSRSLFDFSKIVELFDKYNVSFVSVTQSFNTSNSSGKLMLNILLSFAQFERELSSERIRDKFAASLKQGIWMGGTLPLGYDVKERKLLINEEESQTVKIIFEKFLQCNSCAEVAYFVNKLGLRTKVRKLRNGETIGGQLFDRNAVERILKNPYYKGYVRHKGQAYPGEHKAIINEETWNKVQEILKEFADTAPVKHHFSSSSVSFLRGFLKCSCGAQMKSMYCCNHGLRYRYYICSNHSRYKTCNSPYRNLPAESIERAVLDEIFKIMRSPEVVSSINKLAEKNKEVSRNDLMLALKNLNDVWNFLYQAEQRKIVKMLISSVELKDRGIKITLNLDGFDSLFVQLAS